MIAHLCTNYGPITHSTLETNHASIANVWTPDDPIETLWECLHEIQHISIEGGDPLTDSAIRNLTFIMFETTGVFTTACDTSIEVQRGTYRGYCTWPPKKFLLPPMTFW